ncbi:hypothetical protein LZ017_03445 [Pelomonas sp. CA6]|uniref:hypothetical protein n=1 Tax=Pelomonas sp. CA6 TaxID=2907999 RepID=UPI001F4AC81F|nr:hypothetical protein [Pelomonas sp. CA6]MCH7342431.1 hypothetical protein [Pelomonas sp. CA6]
MPPSSAFTAWFTPALRRKALAAVIGCVALPFGVAELVKTGIQPGIAEDALRRAQLLDYMAIGAMLFGLSMVMAWLVGCWVVAVMKGPQLDGDAFPGDHDRGRDA